MADAGSLEAYKEIAEGMKQHSFEMFKLNTQSAKDGMTVDSHTKVINNVVNKPDKIVATQ
jgi:hypothetical protein